MSITGKKRTLGDVVADKIVNLDKKPYIPSKTALDILEILRGSRDGAKYKDLKRITQVTDTHLARTLHQLEEHNAFNHVEDLYFVTEAGVLLLCRHRGLTYNRMDFVPHEMAAVDHLVKEIRRLHEKLARTVSIPGTPDISPPYWVCVNNEYDKQNKAKERVLFTIGEMKDLEIQKEKLVEFEEMKRELGKVHDFVQDLKKRGTLRD